jgi:hypothetical protein
MTQLTQEQAAIIGAFTGFLCGPFSDLHQYIEKVIGRPVWTHELASTEMALQIREASKADFLALTATPPAAAPTHGEGE